MTAGSNLLQPTAAHTRRLAHFTGGEMASDRSLEDLLIESRRWAAMAGERGLAIARSLSRSSGRRGSSRNLDPCSLGASVHASQGSAVFLPGGNCRLDGA